jgi:hypothetical protein
MILQVLSIMADVIEELFQLNMIKVFFLSEFALLKDTPKCLDHLMAHIHDALAFH